MSDRTVKSNLNPLKGLQTSDPVCSSTINRSEGSTTIPLLCRSIFFVFLEQGLDLDSRLSNPLHVILFV